MRSKTAFFFGVAAAVLLLAAAWRLRRQPRPLKITTNDLEYQEHSPEELTSEHLLDLNTASHDDLVGLGLDGQMSDQIVENRPYRNKLELLSRMVIPEHAYNAIKNQVGVAGATETIKVGG